VGGGTREADSDKGRLDQNAASELGRGYNPMVTAIIFNRKLANLLRPSRDARLLINTIWGQCFMLAVGLIWALVWGWQLTLAGLATTLVFALEPK